MPHLYETEADRAETVPAGEGWPDGVTVAEAIGRAIPHDRNGKTFGPTAWGRAGMEGSPQTYASAADLIRDRYADAPPLPDADPTPAGPGFEFRDHGDTGSASGTIRSATRPTVDDVFRTWGIDPDVWEADRVKVQEQAITLRLRHRRIVPTSAGDGERIVRLDDVPHQSVNWLIGLTLRRRHAAIAVREVAAAVLAEIRGSAPRPVFREAAPEGDHLLVVSIPDLHTGKDAPGWQEGAAREFAAEAVDALLSRVRGFDLDRVLLSFNGDSLHVDGSRRGTTRGTPQDYWGSWRDHFVEFVGTVYDCATRASARCEAEVAVEQGNHDHDGAFYAREVAAARLDGNDRVDVLPDAHPRRYYRYGANLLCFTHGDGVKLADLPLIMATEAPADWAETHCREVFTGHLHHKQVADHKGVVVRVSPALCPPDRWHAARGYVGSLRGAEAVLYHYDHGRVGEFAYAVPRALAA